MLDDPAERHLPIATDTRPALAPGTLVAVGVWACVFAAFIVLGLQS